MGYDPVPVRASVGRVHFSPFVYKHEAGIVECLRCGGRAFTRRKKMADVWERAHDQCCQMKDKTVENSACA